MATSSRRSSGPVLRSHSPTAGTRFCSSPSYSTAFASSSSSFSSRSSNFFSQRSTSPTRVNLCGRSSSPTSVRFAFDRPTSPSRSISNVGSSPRSGQVLKNQTKPQKRTCMCSPTTHPGSFRCSLHKGNNNSCSSTNYSPNRLNARRSAMTNSLVRICGVEGELVKRALAALIRPSSHQQRRRANFKARPSRLSVMSKAEEES